jgi:hypothetical protein
MIVEFTDSVAGTPVYFNPEYVVALRPDPADPTRVTMVALRNGETIRVHGEHREVADRLAGNA